MADDIVVTRIRDRVYRVVADGRAEIVYVAGSASDRWLFWNGRVFRGDFSGAPASDGRGARALGVQPLTAPMPATVLQVNVKVGDAVKKGDLVVLLEAMKMELPLHAAGDATVTAVHCQVGALVPADAVLVELR